MSQNIWILNIICTFSPGTGPQTLGIISNIAEQEGSSKQSCLATMQFKIAIAVLMFGPEKSKETIHISIPILAWINSDTLMGYHIFYQTYLQYSLIE